MKLPADAIIAAEKVTRYLLVSQTRGDKSAFLARGGYTIENADQLLHDLRTQPLLLDATPLHSTEFGQLRNSRPSRRAKWCDLANPLHLDERECVWCHQIHYPNSGEITHRAL